MNKWSQQLGVKFPNCIGCGQCCSCASPSSPEAELREKAKNGDGFAKDFLDIFKPHNCIEDAKKYGPSVVKKSFEIAKDGKNKINKENIIFYKCKYLSDDNKCLIYEDRPQLCRDFPDSPYLIFSDDCAYKEWSTECKKKYKKLQEELQQAKKLQEELNNLKIQNKAIEKLQHINRIEPEYSFVGLVPQMSIVSPCKSWLK